MKAQERANEAAGKLAAAVAELAGPEDGEMVIIVRSSVDGSVVEGTRASGDLMFTWDWFWRPKSNKQEGGGGTSG